MCIRDRATALLYSANLCQPELADAPRFRFDTAQRQAIRAAGFDFVRLAVDIGPFLALQDAARDKLDALLLGTVRDLLDADLGVIVDLHPSAMRPAYRPSALILSLIHI